jgi:hypothetical protein
MASRDSSSRVGRSGAAVLLTLGMVTMLASAAWAGNNEDKEKSNKGKSAAHENNGKGKGKPPGNNGTVKIDGDPLGNGKGNEPHVDCDFNVEFYNFDEGDYNATVTFELQAPTLRDVDGKGKAKKDGQVLISDTVFIGEDPAGGGDDLDASKDFPLDLSGVEAHPKQGYHVKLTVNAPGSQGADKKHKVFWVKCVAPNTPPPTTPPPTTPPPTTPPVTEVTTPTTAPAVTTPTTAPAVSPAVETTATTTPAEQVLGVQVTKPAPAPALAKTGVETQVLIGLAGLAMFLAGLTLLGANAGRKPLTVA